MIRASLYFQLNYKGTKRTIPNTYGLWVAYKNIGELATFFCQTYTNSFTGRQGCQLGARYIFAKNLMGEVHILMVMILKMIKQKHVGLVV